MVKNTFGGSKAKGYARKNEKSTGSNRLRMVEDEAEKYGIVRKIFGGSICEVFCDDLVKRQGIIRGKFRGKGKRNNIIASGTLVLIGLRDWATDSSSEKKLQQADILEVYSSFELDQLKQKPSFPIDFLENAMSEICGNTSIEKKTDGFNFSTIEQVESVHVKDTNIDIIEASEEVDIDDI
jgi:initiation factor 1A